MDPPPLDASPSRRSQLAECQKIADFKQFSIAPPPSARLCNWRKGRQGIKGMDA
jgi:hypothetical protein